MTPTVKRFDPAELARLAQAASAAEENVHRLDYRSVRGRYRESPQWREYESTRDDFNDYVYAHRDALVALSQTAMPSAAPAHPITQPPRETHDTVPDSHTNRAATSTSPPAALPPTNPCGTQRTPGEAT